MNAGMYCSSIMPLLQQASKQATAQQHPSLHCSTEISDLDHNLGSPCCGCSLTISFQCGRYRDLCETVGIGSTWLSGRAPCVQVPPPPPSACACA
jgi:hypothetical protein